MTAPGPATTENDVESVLAARGEYDVVGRHVDSAVEQVGRDGRSLAASTPGRLLGEVGPFAATMCQHGLVTARLVAYFPAAAVVSALAVLGALIDTASAPAAPCPDVQVVFARATTEPPGIGGVGQAFVDSLRSQLGERSVGVYAVNYPASDDFAPSASAGAADASSHVQSMAVICPNTKMVLGGYSQGALVIDLITAYPVPLAGFVPAPLPPEVADHVAAVTVFGNPSDRYVGMPLTAISPTYGPKTIDLCAPGDPICFGGGNMSVPSHDEMFSDAHLSYSKSGMPSQAASFAASRIVG